MILNKREMNMAKRLASDLADINQTNEINTLIAAETLFNEIRSIVIEAWFNVKSSIMEIIESVYKDEKEKKHIYNWHVPIKISPPPMPDLNIPKIKCARSNI